MKNASYFFRFLPFIYRFISSCHVSDYGGYGDFIIFSDRYYLLLYEWESAGKVYVRINSVDLSMAAIFGYSRWRKETCTETSQIETIMGILRRNNDKYAADYLLCITQGSVLLFHKSLVFRIIN